jgi:hypothetical protein
MRVEELQWQEVAGWQPSSAPAGKLHPQLVLYYAASRHLEDTALEAGLRARYPDAHLLGCSTAGEIRGTTVTDDGAVAVAVEFAHTRVETAYLPLSEPSASAAVGEELARALDPNGLVHVFVLAEGLRVNGSELVKGLRAALPPSVAVTGGLAGDGERFGRTRVRLDGNLDDNGVAAVGLYGDRIRIGYGSMGGWDPFGPERVVTRAAGNVLYELDGRPALELYKTYLGSYADQLPASGLLFPLSLRGEDGEPRVVRTILGVDEDQGALVFAGDLPTGRYVRLMKANVDRLVDGAQGAALAGYEAVGSTSPSLAILISCVGRKLVLKQRIEEELDAVRAVLGAETVLSGFYSYGEIAPFRASTSCELHNQTMTITTLVER